jgi:hypothetical protein
MSKRLGVTGVLQAVHCRVLCVEARDICEAAVSSMSLAGLVWPTKGSRLALTSWTVKQ